MRLENYAFLIMATVLTALLALSGCGGEPRATSTLAKRACIEMMQKAPVYYEDFEFWDVRTLREDPDLSEVYKIWWERRGDSLEKFGISSADIDYMADSEGASLVKGEFNLEAIRENIPPGFNRDTGYEDLEVWKRSLSHDPRIITGGMVLAEGLFIWDPNTGGVDAILRVCEGERPSMYDKNAAEVLERLPLGIMTRISRSPYPEGLIVSMMSVEKEAKGTYRWNNVYKFESPEHVKGQDAEEYFKGIEDEIREAEGAFTERGEPMPLHSFTFEQDGEFVEWSVLVEEKYMIALHFYG